MSKVTIPFQPYWKEKMLNGEKTCSSRNKRYGNIKDTFEQFDTTFQITNIIKLPLNFIALNLYKREGCDSPEEFKKVWIELHPRKGWVSDQKVFTHFFKKEGLG